jgi:hypothetical protein
LGIRSMIPRSGSRAYTHNPPNSDQLGIQPIIRIHNIDIGFLKCYYEKHPNINKSSWVGSSDILVL